MASEERQLGVELFNATWELIGSRADDDRMLHMAHASRFHWGEAPECKPENLARGEWLVSRVYTLLGRGEPAIWHGRRCLDHCEENAIGTRSVSDTRAASRRVRGRTPHETRSLAARRVTGNVAWSTRVPRASISLLLARSHVVSDTVTGPSRARDGIARPRHGSA